MKLSLAIGALLLAAPAFAQLAPSPPPPALNEVTADNQLAGNYGLGPRNYPSPEIKQALRHQIEAIESGQPDYGAMTPNTATMLRGQIQPELARGWGPLVSLRYINFRSGAYVYEARYDKAKVRWAIAPLNTEGKITGIAFRTLSQSS